MKTIIIIFIILVYSCSFVNTKTGVRPFVSGVRVENELNAPGFWGYGESGEILVEPGVPVDVVIFGYGLEDVEHLSFTDSVCLTSEFNVTNEDFLIHKDVRIVFKHVFLEWATPWRICLKSETYGWIQIDDDRTWIQTAHEPHETYFPVGIQVCIMIVLFTLSSLCSGLNLGLMSMTPQELKILMRSGSESEAKYAAAILPVRKKGNQLLCTVIIVNVIVNAAITLLFDDLTQGLVAFVSSTAGIVVFGEILPQSLCVKYGLAIGAHTIWITQFFMGATSIITYPLGKILDKYAGADIESVDRGRLVEMLKMNVDQGTCDMDSSILKIAIGAMELRKKVAKDVMTPIDSAFMISEDQVLNAEWMTKIVDSGHSRIPVYEENNRNKVNNLLYVNDLALIGKDNNITVKAVAGFNKRKLRVVDESMPLISLMEEFKLGEYHLAMVAKSNNIQHELHNNGRFVNDQIDSFIANSLKVVEATADMLPPHENSAITLVGLVTLEDITEELLLSEITDETDCNMSDENQKKKRENLSKKRIAQLFCSEKKSEKLSFHMLQMTQKWLHEKSEIFDTTFFDPHALENLIQKNVREVFIVAPKDSEAPSSVKLYESGLLSKRFLVLLEGKATLIFNKTNMSFEVGPWTCFGEPILTGTEKCVLEGTEISNAFYFKPEYDLIVSQNCRFLQITTGTILHSMQITQFMRDIRIPKLSMALEEDSLPELRKFSLVNSTPKDRKRSVSVLDNLVTPTTNLVVKIASVEKLNPLI